MQINQKVRLLNKYIYIYTLIVGFLFQSLINLDQDHQVGFIYDVIQRVNMCTTGNWGFILKNVQSCSWDPFFLVNCRLQMNSYCGVFGIQGRGCSCFFPSIILLNMSGGLIGRKPFQVLLMQLSIDHGDLATWALIGMGWLAFGVQFTWEQRLKSYYSPVCCPRLLDERNVLIVFECLF